MNFEQGFPSSLGMDGTEESMSLIEAVLLIRLCERGITSFGIADQTITTDKAVRSTVLLPIITDYLNHVVAPTMEWQFHSGLNDDLIMRYAGDLNTQQISLDELDRRVTDQVNRPALYNRHGPGEGLLDLSTHLRSKNGMPLSVTLLMLDLTLEQMHEQSKMYQMYSLGEAVNDTLDVTPCLETISRLHEGQPASIPADLETRTKGEKPGTATKPNSDLSR